MDIVINSVVTDKFEMKYFKFGAGDKTAVILPGLSVKSIVSAAESVASAYKSMRDDYTIYVFDRRAVCPENYSIKDMADDTALALDSLGLKNIYLFGVSQGGMIAQYLTLNRPDFVYKLVLCSTIARITKDNFGVIKKWIEFAEKRDSESLNKSIVSSVYSDKFVGEYGEFCLRLMGVASEDELKRFIILAKSCEGFDVYNRLGEIKCPTFVIGSKADKVFDFKYIAELAEKTGAAFKEYEEYGHAVYDETPDCLKEILKFYNQ